MSAPRIVVMGVSGSGKTSFGQVLAARLGIAYRDGDDLHPPENVRKMGAGIALEDADRWPWLDRVAAALATGAPLVVGCSALKRTYRDRIRAGAGGPVRFIHLAGSPALIRSRMAARSGHYMPVSLLDSQLAALEPPGADEAALTIHIAASLERMVDTAVRALESPPA